MLVPAQTAPKITALLTSMASDADRHSLVRLYGFDFSGSLQEREHAEYSAKIVDRKQHLTSEAAYIGRACQQLKLDVSFLKGFGLEALYPDGVQRDVSDIDILVRDCRTFWQIAVMLINSDYELHSAAFAVRSNCAVDGSPTVVGEGDCGSKEEAGYG